MNIALWVLQLLLGLFIFFIGIMQFVHPPGLPAPMAWMYELSPTLRGESQNMFLNVFLAVIVAFVAYGRWKLASIQARGAKAKS